MDASPDLPELTWSARRVLAGELGLGVVQFPPEEATS